MTRNTIARRASLVLCTAGVLAAAAGCGVKPPVYGRGDPHDRSQVHFVDEELASRTAYGQVALTRDESNLLYVTVPIRNTTNKYLYVEYRATFFDRNGQVVTQNTWVRKDLAPNTPDQVSANSTSARAEDVQVDFRKGALFRP